MKIDEVFKYHAPFGTQPARYQLLRAEARILAELIDRNCPDSAEKDMALRSLQQTIMWANASIAINEAGTMQDYVGMGPANLTPRSDRYQQDSQYPSIEERIKQQQEKERVQYKDRAGL